MRSLIALLLALWLAPAWAQVPMTGAGKGAPGGASYSGPGDIVGSAVGFWSCARAYNAAGANTSNSLCDLVATTGGAAVCTLRASSTGFVDLAASYCSGTTPAAACAAASGGACRVSKAYDQTGTGNHLVSSGTLSQNPVLTFSALNGCPGMTFTAVSAARLLSGATVTAAQPFSMTGLAIRTANFTTNQGVISALGVGIDLEFSSVTGRALAFAGTLLTASASNSAYHAMIGVYNNTSSAIVIDGSASTGGAGTNAFSSTIARMGRDSGGGSLDGTIIEAGIWPSGFNATQYGDMNTNMHSSTVGCGSF